jgi:energy-converting hydrogenase Eha subunit A
MAMSGNTYAPQRQQLNKKIHVASLVLSIIGVAFFWGILSYVGLPCAIIALVMSVKKRHTYNTTAAFVMSIIAIGIQVVAFVVTFAETISYFL